MGLKHHVDDAVQSTLHIINRKYILVVHNQSQHGGHTRDVIGTWEIAGRLSSVNTYMACVPKADMKATHVM